MSGPQNQASLTRLPLGSPGLPGSADALEAMLADIWQEVLALPHVGVQDDFFVLGGDSVQATRVILRINDLLDLVLPATIMFHQPTIESLARDIRLIAGPDRLDSILAAIREVAALSAEEAERLLQTENDRT